MNKSEIMNAVKKTYHIFTRVNFALHAARMVREKSYFSEKKRRGGYLGYWKIVNGHLNIMS